MAKTTPKTLPLVWLKFTQYVVETIDHKESCVAFCSDLDRLLDNLASQDAFGTEGQNDPRGDQRR